MSPTAIVVLLALIALATGSPAPAPGELLGRIRLASHKRHLRESVTLQACLLVAA